MAEIDATAEWNRLEELYRQLSDDELEAVADDGYELTDLARQALQAEISQRHLDIKLREAPSVAEDGEPRGNVDPAELDLVVLTPVWDLPEALHIKQVLDDAGIPAYLGPDNVDNAKAFPATFEGGAEMKVREIDQQRALAALAHADSPDSGFPKDEDAEDNPAYAPSCPRCHSREIVFLSLDAALPGKPASQSRYNWHCDACGLRWQDDGVEPEA